MVKRDRQFDDPQQLDMNIQEYFENCKKVGEHPTKAGLTLWLGFASPTSLSDYADGKRGGEQSEAMAWYMKTAITRIEDYWNQRLDGAKNPAGAIFYQKAQFGYRDRDQDQPGLKASFEITDEEMARMLVFLGTQKKVEKK